MLSSATVAVICKPGYAASVRSVPASEQVAVYAEYGIPGARNGGAYEVDRLISLELGGSNAIANLWPAAVAPKPGLHEKRGLETYLHRRVCSGAMTLAAAQRTIATDWLAAYKKLH